MKLNKKWLEDNECLSAWNKRREEIEEELKTSAFDLLVHSGGAGKITLLFDIGTIEITQTKRS